MTVNGHGVHVITSRHARVPPLAASRAERSGAPDARKNTRLRKYFDDAAHKGVAAVRIPFYMVLGARERGSHASPDNRRFSGEVARRSRFVRRYNKNYSTRPWHQPRAGALFVACEKLSPRGKPFLSTTLPPRKVGTVSRK